jgi:hypothetical protein
MPRGPRGEKRLADVVGNAVLVAKIATGEVKDEIAEKNPHAVALGKLGGKKGGRARARKLTAKERKSIAQNAANSRWKGKD